MKRYLQLDNTKINKKKASICAHKKGRMGGSILLISSKFISLNLCYLRNS